MNRIDREWAAWLEHVQSWMEGMVNLTLTEAELLELSDMYRQQVEPMDACLSILTARSLAVNSDV